MPSQRRYARSGSPFEPRIGFSRAVRVDGHVAVAGTAPIDANGATACPGDVYGQTKRCFEIAQRALHEVGSALEHVTRTRILLTNIDSWAEAARAHAEFFATIRPACTFVQVVRFIEADWLVEIEVDAIAPELEGDT